MMRIETKTGVRNLQLESCTLGSADKLAELTFEIVGTNQELIIKEQTLQADKTDGDWFRLKHVKVTNQRSWYEWLTGRRNKKTTMHCRVDFDEDNVRKPCWLSWFWTSPSNEKISNETYRFLSLINKAM